MDPRQIFTSQHWWGKFIGGSLGFLILGPTGALFGILIGNLFDRGLAEHFSRPYWHFHAEKRKAIQKIFFEATFLVMGHLSKTDGRVTERQISMASQLMQDMRLNKQQQQLAQHCFCEGKKNTFDLWNTLSSLRDATKDNPALLKLFIDIQFKSALVDGLSIKKQQLINSILNYMGYAPLQQQHRFYEDFGKQTNYQQHQSNYSSSTHQKTYHKPQTSTEYAYSILGVPVTANKLEVKRAYQRLISRNHPDKLIAKGLPEAMIKVANEKTQQIRKAYEQICAEKGW